MDAFKRAVQPANRRDIEAGLEEIHPEVERYPALQAVLGGEATVYRGHDGVHEVLRGAEEAWAKSEWEFSEMVTFRLRRGGPLPCARDPEAARQARGG